MPLKSRGLDPSLLAVIGEGFLSRLSFGIIGFALPLYAYHLGLGIGAIGVLISINVMSEMMLKPALAPLADRFSPKVLLSGAVATRSIVAFLLVFAWLPWQLFAVRIIHGASEAARDPSVNAIIAVSGEESKIASSFAWYHTAKVLAGSVGKAVAGFLLTITLSNYNLVFFTAFLLSAFPFLVVVRYVKRGKNMDPATPRLGRELPGNEKGGEMGGAAILGSFGFGALMSGTAAMISNLFPLIATKYAGLSEAKTGMIYLVSTFVVVFAGPVFGWLADNVSRRLVLLTRSVANTLSSFLYILFPSFAGVLTARVMDDAGKAAFRPAWGALMARVSGLDKARQARIMGYMGLAENVGETAGPLLAGWLWQAQGIVVMLLVRAGLSIVTEIYAAFATGPLRRRKLL